MEQTMKKLTVFSILVVLVLAATSSTIGAGKPPPPPPPAEYDFVNIGDSASEAGHNLYGWGPVNPDTVGGHWGGDLVDWDPMPCDDGDCRVISSGYSGSEGMDGVENNFADWARLTLDFGSAKGGKTRCLLLRSLEGHAKDSFYVYLDNMKKKPIYYWPGDDSAGEWWVTHAIPLSRNGVHTIYLVSDQSHWSGWGTFGQVAFTWAKVVKECP